MPCNSLDSDDVYFEIWPELSIKVYQMLVNSTVTNNTLSETKSLKYIVTDVISRGGYYSADTMSHIKNKNTRTE